MSCDCILHARAVSWTCNPRYGCAYGCFRAEINAPAYYLRFTIQMHAFATCPLHSVTRFELICDYIRELLPHRRNKRETCYAKHPTRNANFKMPLFMRYYYTPNTLLSEIMNYVDILMIEKETRIYNGLEIYDMRLSRFSFSRKRIIFTVER